MTMLRDPTLFISPGDGNRAENKAGTADTALQVIDAHQHFWSIGNPGHQWPTPAMPDLYRDFAPAHLRRACGPTLAGTVLVQSQPTDADTDWMLRIAGTEPLVRAVVGWVDLADPDAPRRIASLSRHPLLRGLRPMLQCIADTDWLLDTTLEPAISAMIEHGLRFDALVEPRHLPMLAKFADRWPDLPIVIDHAGKPPCGAGPGHGWWDDIAVLASLGLHCKLSGLRTEQGAGRPADALAGIIAHLQTRFGSRLMWGSDWPVLLLSGSGYGDWLDAADRLTGLDGRERSALFADTARRFYGIDPGDGDGDA